MIYPNNCWIGIKQQSLTQRLFDIGSTCRLGIDNFHGNPTYIPTTLTEEEIQDNYRSVLCSLEILAKMMNLIFLHYWIPNDIAMFIEIDYYYYFFFYNIPIFFP